MTEVAPRSLFWREAEAAGFDSVCALDFEGSDRTGVVEFGYVVFDAGGIRKTRTELCRPHATISVREAETHGLRGHEFGATLPFAEYWEEFRDLRIKSPFLAHSASVEDRFLRRQWRTVGEVFDWSEVPSRVIGWGPWLDSCTLARSVIEGGSAALRPLVEGWGLSGELERLAAIHCPARRRGWHAALYDSLASVLVFRRVLEARPGWGIRRVFAECRGTGSDGEQAQLF